MKLPVRPGWGLAGLLNSVATLLVCAATASAQAPTTSGAITPPSGTTGPTGPTTTALNARPDQILSNETTFTTWSTAISADPVRSQPSKHARVITRLRFLTSDGFLQSYIALRQRHTAHGLWVEIRLPMRPNGLTGWVRREALETYSVVHTQLVLNRAQHNITLFINGKAAVSAPVGVGKSSTPTPPGHFWITEKFAVHRSPVYGPFAFGTSDYSVLTDWPGGGIVGLHGTNQPQLVPGNPSHGCIRLHNTDILRLARLVPIGTPLLIL